MNLQDLLSRYRAGNVLIEDVEAALPQTDMAGSRKGDGMSEREEWLKERIVKIITSFEREQMSVAPTSVSLDMHPHSLVVMFRGAACPADMALADNDEMARLLERFYGAVFDAAKQELEKAIASVLGCLVTRSKFTMDPRSGDGFLLFGLAAYDARTGAEQGERTDSAAERKRSPEIPKM